MPGLVSITQRSKSAQFFFWPCFIIFIMPGRQS